MAIKKDVFNLSGKLGNVIHYIRNGKGYVRSASTDHKSSESSEKSSTEFGNASSSSRLIRTGFATIIKNMTDNGLINRLNVRLAKIIRTGPADLTGKRQVIDGDLDLLRGFELNRQTSLANIMGFTPKTRIEATDKIHITLPEFVTRDSFKAPPPSFLCSFAICL